MKRKIAVIILCVVFLVGTFYVFASDALINQEDKTDAAEIAETVEPAESAEPESTAEIVIETSPEPDSETAEPTASAAAEEEDLSRQAGENETETTASQYPSNFYELAQVLNSRDINTVGVCDILTSYLYLRDVYGLSNQELEYIAGLIIGGAEPSDIMEAAYFWLDTCEDISIIEQIYNKKSEYEGGKFWVENAYNDVTEYIHGELSVDDVNHYLEVGAAAVDIQNANVLSRRGVYTIQQILDRIIGGETIVDVMNDVYGTNITQPVSLFGLNENEEADENILDSKELAGLENKQIEESAEEILSDSGVSERLSKKRNEKNAGLVEQLVINGIIPGRIDEDLGVIFDE